MESINRADNLRRAYHVTEDEVNTALRTQLGDAAQLNLTRGKVLRLAEQFEQVSPAPRNSQQSFNR
jgi:hypothetical protein